MASKFTHTKPNGNSNLPSTRPDRLADDYRLVKVDRIDGRHACNVSTQQEIPSQATCKCSKQPESALTKRLVKPLSEYIEGRRSSKKDNGVAAYNLHLEEYMDGYINGLDHRLVRCDDSFDISFDPDEDLSLFIFVNDDSCSIMSDITATRA